MSVSLWPRAPSVHVGAGLLCVFAGAIAALSPKRAPRHPRAGTVYFWSLVVAVVTMFLLGVTRWSEDRVLVAIGLASLTAALVGRIAIRRAGAPANRHVIGMGTSYTLLLVAFYVDNGAHLPLWRTLPPVTYWAIPAGFGALIVSWAAYRHRNMRAPFHR